MRFYAWFFSVAENRLIVLEAIMEIYYLRQQILALPGLNGRSGQVILHLVTLNSQVLEILVGDAELMDSLQYLFQCTLLIPEDRSYISVYNKSYVRWIFTYTF